MCCTTKLVKLLSLKSLKTAIFSSVSFMTSHDDVIDKKYKPEAAGGDATPRQCFTWRSVLHDHSVL